MPLQIKRYTTNINSFDIHAHITIYKISYINERYNIRICWPLLASTKYYVISITSCDYDLMIERASRVWHKEKNFTCVIFLIDVGGWWPMAWCWYSKPFYIECTILVSCYERKGIILFVNNHWSKVLTLLNLRKVFIKICMQTYKW